MRATHEVKFHSVITAKDVTLLLPPECRTPVVIKQTDRKEGEMPETTDITKRIEKTLPKLHKTKINVAINGRGDNVTSPRIKMSSKSTRNLVAV